MTCAARIVAAVATGALLLVSPNVAQEVADETARVDYVLIDVVAMDKKRNLITDLTAADFTLTENKKAVRIESFDVLDARTSPLARAEAEAVLLESEAGFAIRQTALYLVAIDLEFARMPEVHRTFKELDRFFRDPGMPRGEYQLVSLEDGVLTEYLPDPEQARLALGRYATEYEKRFTGVDGGAGAGWLSSGRAAPDLTSLEARFEDCRYPATTGAADVAMAQACILEELQVFLMELRIRTERVLDELKHLTDDFPDATRVNTVLFVSPGFSLRPGAAATRLAGIYMDLGRPVGEDRMERGGASARTFASMRSYEEEFLALVHEALARRVVFHTFDIYNFNMQHGRQVDVEFRAASNVVLAAYRDQAAELEEGMVGLARESGGYYHRGPNLGDLDSIGDRTAFVYTLGYTAPEGDSGRFRRIRIKCKRKGVKLHHRTGYFPG